jgi:lysophospholipase L1-like esterase
MQQKMKRYLALGDSYTVGEMVPAQQCFPNRLIRRLTAAGVAVAMPTILAKTGWTTADLLNSLGNVNLTDPFDLVTLLIGVNNQYQGLSLEKYRHDFRQLLQKAIACATGDPTAVIILSIPDWSATPFARGKNRGEIKNQIAQFNRVNHQETQLAETHYLDITPISRRAEADPNLLSSDQLHPSPKMYSDWVDLIYPTAYQILRK